MTFPLHPCPPGLFCITLSPLHCFEIWQSGLIGAATLIAILMLAGAVNSDLRRLDLNVGRVVRHWPLQVASLMLGAAFGIWTAQLTFTCSSLFCSANVGEPRFALWQCACMGAAVAAPFLVASFAARRPAAT